MMNKNKKTFFLLTVFASVLVFGSGCGSEGEKNQADISAEHVDQKEGEVQREEQTAAEEEFRKAPVKKKFDGVQRVKTSEGRMWTPPAGSYEDTDGYIYDQEGAVIGMTGPVKYNPNAKG